MAWPLLAQKAVACCMNLTLTPVPDESVALPGPPSLYRPSLILTGSSALVVDIVDMVEVFDVGALVAQPQRAAIERKRAIRFCMAPMVGNFVMQFCAISRSKPVETLISP